MAESRSFAWLRVLDDARLDQPVEDEVDAAEIVEPYRWLLARIGDGVKLTQAGYLPPAIVNEATPRSDGRPSGSVEATAKT